VTYSPHSGINYLVSLLSCLMWGVSGSNLTIMYVLGSSDHELHPPNTHRAHRPRPAGLQRSECSGIVIRPPPVAVEKPDTTNLFLAERLVSAGDISTG
jgi:hypothetical protein